MTILCLLLALQEPAGWTLEKEIDGGASARHSVDSCVTRWYKRSGVHARVNIIEFSDENAAKRWEDELNVRRGKVVYQFSRNPTGKRLCQDMGLSSGAEVAYDVTLKIACVDSLDYMAANRVTNLLIAGKDVAELTRGWTFGKSVRLLGEWTFAPEPSGRADEGGVVRYTFEKPPVDRVPHVEAKATLRVRDWYTPRGKAVDGLTRATAFWPVDEVRDLAKKITADAKTDIGKLDAILAWVSSEIRYGGDVVGSRFGVAKVLEQKSGRCWDKADVLVTLARAAGLPARQVGGWVHGLEGHIWCEVWVGDGWLPVDATCPWPGVSDDYVPFFRTDDGAMPIVYLALPKVVRK